MVDTTQPDRHAPATDAERLLALVDAALRDLSAGTTGLPAVTLDSQLDRDLGLDSLARMELVLRTEREFGVELPQDTLQRAETVGDLLQAVARCAAGAGRPAAGAARRGARGRRQTQRVQAWPPSAPAWPRRAPCPKCSNGICRPTPTRRRSCCCRTTPSRPSATASSPTAASAFAAGLQRGGVKPRQCVAIMLPTSADYFGIYLGILKAGAIPVPIYPPARASQLEDHVLRHAGILDNAQAVLLVTVAEALGVARLLQARVPGLRRVVTARDLAAQRWRTGAGHAARRRHRLHPVHLGQHRRPQGRGADARQPARQHPRHGAGHPGHAARRLRQLAAAVPRHGPDRRLAGQPVRRLPAGGDVAAGLPVAAAALAAGDPSLPRHAFGRRPTSPTNCASGASTTRRSPGST